jgi:hypothetical protein
MAVRFFTAADCRLISLSWVRLRFHGNSVAFPELENRCVSWCVLLLTSFGTQLSSNYIQHFSYWSESSSVQHLYVSTDRVAVCHDAHSILRARRRLGCDRVAAYVRVQ